VVVKREPMASADWEGNGPALVLDAVPDMEPRVPPPGAKTKLTKKERSALARAKQVPPVSRVDACSN
jgi:hypothetical protein